MNTNVIPLPGCNAWVAGNHGGNLAAVPATNSKWNADALATEHGRFLAAKVTAQNGDAATGTDAASLCVAADGGW